MTSTRPSSVPADATAGTTAATTAGTTAGTTVGTAAGAARTSAGTIPTRDTDRVPEAPLVRVDAGRGGLPRVLVRTAVASAEVYLHGAHVTAWAPAGQAPVIWTSEHSTFAPGSPIRGGVPVAFPWFGADPSGAGPLHGVVRLLPWRFTGWETSGDDVVLTFALSSADLDGAAPFALRYSVTVGARLTLSLEVVNTGPGVLRFEDGLNVHLAVPDVTAVVIDGLGGLERLDRLTGRRTRVPAGAGMRVVAETDHLYREPGPVTVTDWEAGRRIHLQFPDAGDAVVWNPWSDRAATMADMGDDDWSRMVGIGPGDIADAAVVLAPGATHTLTATIDVGALS